MKYPAQHYVSLDDTLVQCRLCPANCKIKPAQRGICRSRFNENGELFTDNFGETVTIAIDPIEKKPLYHFLPGSDIVSIGPNGCNFSCRHCQNWQISQATVGTTYIPPEKLPKVAGKHGSIGVAYTYTEPFIWFEYIKEAAPRVRDSGGMNVVVSNGYINPDPLREILPLIDAFNIDVKGMRPEFYTAICKGRLDPVLETIRIIADSPAHLEITNLVIPGYNDEESDFRKLGEFIASVNRNIPLHLSAYHPSYRLDAPPTPRETILHAYDTMKHYCDYVFVGNMRIPGDSDTRCPSCQATLIVRTGHMIRITGLDYEGNCVECGYRAGIRLKDG